MASITKLKWFENEAGERCSGKVAGAVQKESSTWYLIGYDQRGKFVRKATGTESKAKAEDMLVLFSAGLMKGQVTEANSKTFKYEELLSNYVRAKRPDIRICIHLKYFQGMKVVDINRMTTIEAFIEHRRNEIEKEMRAELAAGKLRFASGPRKGDLVDADDEDDFQEALGYKGSSIGRSLKTLRAMLWKAQEAELIPTVCHIPIPKDNEPAGQYVPPADFANVLSKMPKNLHPAFSFMYATACRLGATQKITWRMVNKDCTVIALPGTIIKTKKPLLVVLDESDAAVKFMRTQFVKDADKPVFDFTNFRPEWGKAVQAANLGTYDSKTNRRTGIRIHDMRCSGAINALAAGVDEGTVLKIGGWKTRGMLDRYNVQHEGILKAAAAKRAKYVSEQQKIVNS